MTESRENNHQKIPQAVRNTAENPRNQERDWQPSDSKAAPHPGAARTKPTAKRKNSQNTPATGSPNPKTLTRSRIARPGRPQTPAASTLLGGQIADARVRLAGLSQREISCSEALLSAHRIRAPTQSIRLSISRPLLFGSSSSPRPVSHSSLPKDSCISP